VIFRYKTVEPPDPLRLAGAGALGAILLSALLLPGRAASQAAAPAQNPPPAARRAGIPYPRPATPEQLAFFEKKVRPILVDRCYNCHSNAFKGAGGLRVDTGLGFFTGGNGGPVIVPGQPEQSLLIARLKSTELARRMPQESAAPLPAEQIEILETWIKDGAAWPDETEKAPQAPAHLKQRYAELKGWWAWQPLKNPSPPAVAHKTWSQAPIDRFLLAKLEANHLAPVADADPTTLIRRLTFDLTGLPPAPADVKDFVRECAAENAERAILPAQTEGKRKRGNERSGNGWKSGSFPPHLSVSPSLPQDREKTVPPKAYERLVDRLLASPQFGERWGRHWLDLARYGESSGPSRNMPYPHAWRYRDYVIDAYNRDLPFNRFVQEQIAGDLLPAPAGEERDRLTIATGFLALGVKDVNQRFKARFKMDNVDEMIDTVTRSTLGLTVSCARCHDHKFDPIPTRDYYGLAGIFASTEDGSGLGSGMGGGGLFYYKPKLLGYLSTTPAAAEVKPADPKAQSEAQAQAEAARKALMEFNRKIQAERAADPNRVVTAAERQQRMMLQRKQRRLTEAAELANDLGEQGYGIHCVREGEVADTTIRVRGEEERHGPTVPRGYLSLASLPGVPPIPADHSGRLELTQWITAPQNPLTTRVYVNRIWQHLFGLGLVRTPDNFGSTGDRPSHPELLDYLAQDFIRKGWSTKRLIREIVLTRAYRLGGAVPAGYRDRDPENRLVWRHSPRRLTTEEIRDGILFSSGRLDLQRPKGSATMSLRVIEMRDDGPVVQSVLQAADRSRNRSIYLPQIRGSVPRPLAAFDPVTQSLVTGKRDTTLVPAQALFVLNSPFVREEALRLADALAADTSLTDAARIAAAYERVFSRTPTPRETARAAAFVKEYALVWARGQGAPATAVASSTTPAAATNEDAGASSGIVRADNVNQDDPDQPSPGAAIAPPASPDPRTPQQAAWAALVQALYGSADFQFLR